jgi:TatD DNase family protein
METDSPDIPAALALPHRRRAGDGQPQARNEPGELPRIAALLAGLRGETPEALAQQTCRNAQAALPKLESLMKNGL